MKGSDLRIKLLTLKHHIHQQLLEFLASPNAPIYLKVIGVCLVFFLFILFVQIVSLIWTFISYHRLEEIYFWLIKFNFKFNMHVRNSGLNSGCRSYLHFP